MSSLPSVALRSFLNSERSLPKHGVPQGSGLSFLCQKLFMENINKCYLQIILLTFTNYNLNDFKNVECLNP